MIISVEDNSAMIPTAANITYSDNRIEADRYVDRLYVNSHAMDMRGNARKISQYPAKM